MMESLRDLDQQLKQKNSRLHLFFGKTQNVIKELLGKENICAVHLNNDYTVFSKTRDDDIFNICRERNVKCFRYSDLLLINDPRSIMKPSDGKAYTVFTHFFNKAIEVSTLKPQKNNYNNYSSRSSYSLSKEIEDRKKKKYTNRYLKHTIQRSMLEAVEVNA